jgi:hypothetical protein
MREANPFGKGATANIVETHPRSARIPANARAVCILPDLRERKARPRADDMDAVMARLPPHTVELLAIDYNCLVSRLPCLDRQSHIRYAHIGGRRLRDYSPLFTLTRLESLFLVSAPLASLSSFQSRRMKRLRLIRGRVTHLDLSTEFALLQSCAQLSTFGNVSIGSLALESCPRVDLTSLAKVRGLRQLRLLAPGALPSITPLLGCESLESLVITATPLSKTDLRALCDLPSLKWVFLAVGDARVAELTKALPRLMVTNGSACFRDTKPVAPRRYYQEVEAARF